MFKKFLLSVSVLPVLAIMPAMADQLTWAHPDNIESYTVVDGNVNYVLNGGSYNIITGTGMRNTVNGDVNVTLNGVTQVVSGGETNVYGILFLPSTGSALTLQKLTGETPTAEQAQMQMYVNGDVNLNVYNSTIGQSVVGVNFYVGSSELTQSGLSGKTTVTVDNSTVEYSVRGTNYYNSVPDTIPEAKVGDIEINVNDSLIKEEIVSAGSAASAGNVVINVTGNTVIGYTELDSDTTKGDGWIIAGANRKGATIQSTEVNLNTAGLIRIAGDVNVGSRDRHTSTSTPDTDEDSVIGDATLNMLGGGTINIGGDLRAYHVGGKTTLNIGDIVANVVGDVANEFQEVNMSETAALNVGGTFAMTADGVLNMTLLSPDSYSQIVADSIDANGAALNFTVSHEGVYEVLDFDELVSDFRWNRENALYNLLHEEGTGIITAELKSVEDIAADNNLTQETAHTVAMLAESSSDQLNNLAISVQNSLANGDADAVEQAHKAIRPETESVVQSVSMSMQNAIANLTAARMSGMPSLGRSGGDTPAHSGVWVEGMYNKSKQNDAFNGYTRGIALGVDTQIARGLMLGAGYSYAHSDVSGTVRDTEIDSNTIFVYGQYKPTAWYVNAMANYTMSDYSEKSNVLGTLVKSDFDVDAFGAAVMTGYDFAGGITPEIGLRYMHISADEYKNSLDVKSKLGDSDYLTAILGTKYAFNYRVARGLTLRPELRYAVKYDMISDKQVATITMPGVPSYVLDGNRLSRIGAEFGGGLVVKYSDFSLALNYDIELREGYTSQTGRVRARLVF